MTKIWTFFSFFLKCDFKEILVSYDKKNLTFVLVYHSIQLSHSKKAIKCLASLAFLSHLFSVCLIILLIYCLLWKICVFQTSKLFDGEFDSFVEECQALQAPASGYLSLLSNGTVTSAEVSCLNGYHVHGNSKLTCDSNGVWDMETPTCGI